MHLGGLPIGLKGRSKLWKSLLTKPLDKTRQITYYIGTRYIGTRYNAERYNNSYIKGSRMNKKSLTKHLPLTEVTYYILLSLVTPKHGYAVMQEAEEISAGTVRLGPGTLYGAFTSLEKNKLISMVDKKGRRKIYQITEKGIRILFEQVDRLKIMIRCAEKISGLLPADLTKEGN
jgi:DNA-binding PadR family transcriptional regulator